MAKEIRGMLYATSMRHRMLEYFQDWQPDAIYERYSLLATAGVELAQHLKIPHILEVNAPLSKEAAEHRAVAFQHTIEATERRILNTTSHVVSVSEPIRQWAKSLGVAVEQISVMPNGVNIERFERLSDVVTRQLLRDHRPVVGFVGTLKAWHGTPTLIRALGYIARVNGHNHAPQLLIVGDGPQREMLEQLATDEGVAELVVFTGSVPHNDISSWISRMDISVAPYDDLQNFYFSPLKVYEYMAAGKAIVASNIGQIAECLTDRVDGLLYHPGDVTSLADKIMTLLENKPLRDALGQNARRNAVANHSWVNNASSVTSLILQHKQEDQFPSHVVTVGGHS